jgi:peroxiredoxin Q/BCP
MYFYPMDDTPGCTKQACSLRDHNAEIVARGAAILGVSTQDEASHRRFTEKYKLNFPLLADAGGAVGRAYGTIGGGGLISAAKALVGMADRVTFIIDEKGRIAHVIDRPDVANHAEEVLALL